jgi:hypothetical protein
MIVRRLKSGFTPNDVQEVRRRFHDIVRKAAHKAEALPKQTARPLKLSGGTTSER